jgi:hypothetical protein
VGTCPPPTFLIDLLKILSASQPIGFRQGHGLHRQATTASGTAGFDYVLASVATHPRSKAGGSFLFAVGAAESTLCHGTLGFTSGDVVAEKPQFFSLADDKAFFDIFGSHVTKLERRIYGLGSKSEGLGQHF